MQIAPPAPRRGAVTFIFITVMLDMLSLGMIAPVLPKLVAGFVGGDAARAAEMFGLFGTVWALAPTLSWLFLGRAISGVTSARLITADAYIADVAPLDKRAAGFGMLSAAFGVGFVHGPAVGGLLGGFNPRFPFWVAAAFSLANALYGTLVLPESLPPEKRTARVPWERANPLGSLKLLRSHPELSGLSVVGFLSALAGQSFPAIWVLFTIYQYHWGTSIIGLSLAMVGITTALVQGFLVRPIVARFGERTALVAGLGFGAIGMTMFGFANTPFLFWTGIAVMAMWGFAPAASQSLMSRRVSPAEQGELQGAISCIRSLTALVGPGLFTLTFVVFMDTERAWFFPGAAWMLGGLLVAAAVPLA